MNDTKFLSALIMIFGYPILFCWAAIVFVKSFIWWLL